MTQARLDLSYVLQDCTESLCLTRYVSITVPAETPFSWLMLIKKISVLRLNAGVVVFIVHLFCKVMVNRASGLITRPDPGYWPIGGTETGHLTGSSPML